MWKLSLWGLTLLATVGFLWALGYTSGGGLSFAQQAFLAIGMLVFGLLYVATFLPRLLARRVVPPSWRLQLAPGAIALVAALVLMSPVSYQLFRLRFEISREALTSFAQKVQAEGVPAGTPALMSTGVEVDFWIGVLPVKEVEKLPAAIRLITADCGLNSCGVVYSPLGEPPVIGEDVYRQMRDDWWFWFRSW